METKPRPLNTREFLTSLTEPYQQPERVIQPYENPNSKVSLEAQPGQPEFNRASQVSLKDDNHSTINLGLQEHDDAVLYYLENVIRPTVTHNERQIAVPIIYGSPERWKSIQYDGFYRDKNGKTMAPLIMFKRESFEKNRSLGNKLDGNVVHNVQYFEKKHNLKTTKKTFESSLNLYGDKKSG
jgi:hypothetical protein